LKLAETLLLATAIALFSSSAHAHGVALVFPVLAFGSFFFGLFTGAAAAKLELRIRATLAIGLGAFFLLALLATFTNSPSVDGYLFMLLIGSLSAFLPWAISHIAAHRVVLVMLRRKRG
jgi:hypothetical protein